MANLITDQLRDERHFYLDFLVLIIKVDMNT
jgi:hypothetical protein